MHPTVVMGMHLARKVAPIVFRHSPVSQHRHALICPDLGCGRPEDDREMAEEILLAAAARGMVLADLAGLAGEMYERSRSGQPDEDKDRPFDDRAVKLATTFGGAGVLHGDLTPECATIVETVLDALSAPAGAGDTRTHEQRYHDALQEAMRRLAASDLLPERAGQPVKAWVHVSLAELMLPDGSSALLEEWTVQVRAQWAAHRARASEGSGTEGAWLDGDAAAAMTCDAAMAPRRPGRAGELPAPPAARRPAGRAQPAAGHRVQRDHPGRDPPRRHPA
jgi:Domain of unknown function (DUF222)